jgi:hypothetical protein
MGESFSERIASFVGVRSWRWVDMDIVVYQELLQHFSCGNEEVAVASLTTELESIFRRCLGAGNSVTCSGLDVWHNRDLQFAFDSLNKASEFRRTAEAWQVRTGGDCHVGLEWDMFL